MRLHINLKASSESLEEKLGPIEFPSLITELRIYIWDSFKQIDKFINHLPPKLQIFGFSHKAQKGITDEMVASLPRTIHSMWLSKRDNLTANCLPNLPPRLSTLELEHNTALVPSSPLMPYKLRKISSSLHSETRGRVTRCEGLKISNKTYYFTFSPIPGLNCS